jgi:hypothetical protein
MERFTTLEWHMEVMKGELIPTFSLLPGNLDRLFFHILCTI